MVVTAKRLETMSKPIPQLVVVLFVVMVVAFLQMTTVSAGEEDNGERFVFPFYPRELDILIGHLHTKVYRIEESLDTCRDINDGDHDAGSYTINIYDNGDADDAPSGRVSKIEKIAKLRKKIDDLEDDLEKCRFKFWTGDKK